MNASIGFYFNVGENSSTERFNRREVRKKAGNLLEMSDEVFEKQFRLNKPAFQYLLNILEANLPPSVRSTSVTTEAKLATFLRFLAEGGYQNGTGKDYNVGLAQPTVSVVISEVLEIFERKLCPKWIKLKMTDEEEREARLYFYEKARIPGILMCVDGTHVKMIKPSGDSAHNYYNRKGFYSLNVMVICDHKQRIRYIDAKYPGAAHDSFVWRNSDVNQYFKSLFDNGERSMRILGDSGYPLLPWLITPYRNASYNTPKSRFNRSHSAGRNIVERTIGLWKNWCRCLLSARQLHYAPEKVAKIVNVSAAIHNIRLHYNVHDEYVPQEIVEVAEEEDGDNEASQRYTEIAREMRDDILRNFN